LYIVNSIEYFWPQFSISHVTLWTVVLSHMSCALNPLIYAYGMPGFKKALREFLNIGTDQSNTGVNYSCYMRSSEPTKLQCSLKNRIRR
uniref:G_PROTEIN_RECEP_F1_2 domain-containing protein n=1 Tax=Heligmosomoides polygyrus TaxID=6339 RepID=A0A183FBS0_HELPZ